MTKLGSDLSYPQRVASELNWDVLIFKVLIGKKMLACRLCSSSTLFASPSVLFSSPILSSARREKNDHLIFPRATHNRQTSKSTRNKPGIQAQSYPENKIKYQYIRFSKRWLLLFPPGSNYLLYSLASSISSGLQLIYRKTDFDETDYVGVWLSVCVPIMSSFKKKMCLPKF